jgi:hypothetical protein
MSTERSHRASDLGRRCATLGHSRALSVLGPDHPLTRRTELIHVLATQAVTAAGAAVVAAIAVAERFAWASTVLRIAVIVELALLAILALVRQIRREEILRVIASGQETLPLDAAAHQARHLARPGH